MIIHSILGTLHANDFDHSPYGTGGLERRCRRIHHHFHLICVGSNHAASVSPRDRLGPSCRKHSRRSVQHFGVRGVVMVIASSDRRCIASANKPTPRDVDNTMPLQSACLLWVPGDGEVTSRLDHAGRVWGRWRLQIFKCREAYGAAIIPVG